MADDKRGVWIPGVVLADDQLGASCKIIYAIMLAGADDCGFSRVGADELVALTGMTYQGVMQVRYKLERIGYIDTVPRKGRQWCLKHLEERNG